MTDPLIRTTDLRKTYPMGPHTITALAGSA